MNSRPAVRFITLTTADVRKPYIQAFGTRWFVQNFIGQILPQDVGKRAYMVDRVLQVESKEQYERRTA